MPRKKKPVDDSDLQQLDTFAKQVENALLHFGDPAWLGKHSPLAQPWVLGAHLQGRGDTPADRGELLRELIVEAATTLVDDEERNVVLVGYVKRDPYLTNAGVALRLHMNERRFFRKRAAAVRNMAVWLYSRLISPLRLENPPLQPIAGRHRERSLCRESLLPGKSVSLAGPSGIGKSTLAAEVAREMGAAVFWFTVRPEFNDNLESLLFALAWFLRQQGAHNLWLQILANSQELDSERIAGLLRYDLSTIPADSCLICIDEVDLLNADTPEHARMLHVIDIVRPYAPLLFVGQRAALISDAVINLGALPEAELREWHATLGSELHVPFDFLYKQTQGIPVLLTAWLILVRSDPTYATLIDDSRPITLESAFQRVWRRLPGEERLLIAELGIHGGTAPVEILTVGESATGAERSALEGLIARALVFEPSSGIAQLPAYLANLVQRYLDDETRTLLHLRVAHRLEERGQHIDAIYHWITGGRADAAIWLWFRHRNAEINRGNAVRALRMLDAVESNHLSHERDRIALQITLAELRIHHGQADEAQAILNAATYNASPSARAHLSYLRADIAELKGNLEQALDLYRESLDTLLGTNELRESDLRVRVGQIYHSQMINLAEARRQALLFRFRAEVNHAATEEIAGNYEEAQKRYEAAGELLNRIPEAKRERARLYLDLSANLIVQGKHQEAVELMEEAVFTLDEIGALRNALVGKSNLAYAYIQHGNPTRALEIVTEALPKARRTRNAYLIAPLACDACEAHLFLGDLDAAETFAVEAVQQEDDFYQHWSLALYALVHSRRGAHDAARMLAQQGLDSARDTGNPYSIGYCERQLGEVYKAAGAPGEARTWYTQARTTYANVGLEREVQELDAILAELTT